MPMKYIGRSINDNYYSIFKYEPGKPIRNTKLIDIEFLINNFGTFSIPLDYYDAFKVLGSFINGKDSIMLKWAEFSVNASGKKLSLEKVINEVLKSPITVREVEESKKLYKNILKNEGKVYCVWTGKSITTYDIDHVIPFSIWKNNDLWNLLPAQAKINNQKRDKIPSSLMIDENKELIFYYWGIINKYQMDRFQREIKITLLGNDIHSDWKQTALNNLKNNCNYLIKTRGYEEWQI
jgi:hypothetical protein